MRSIGIVVLAFGVVLGLSGMAQALTVIDDFATGAINADTNTGTAPDNTETVASTDTIGGERTLTLTETTPLDTNALEALANPPSGILQVSHGSSAAGSVVLLYDGVGSPAGGFTDTDLTAGGMTGIEIVFTALDHGNTGNEVTILIEVANGATFNSSKTVVMAAGAGATTVFVSYAAGGSTGIQLGGPQGGTDLAFTTQATLATANKIRVTFTGANAADYDLTLIQASGTTVIPEPSTLLLGAVGLAFAAVRRRFKR